MMRRTASCCCGGSATSCEGFRNRLRMSEPLVCAARGWQATALYAVVWNNPRIHPPEREKIWLACEAHRQRLADYLDVRGFLRRVERL